ncbi:Toxin subunit YenB-like protein [Cladobotryum mycophilum]|uniref:Toxin subunit YenB-like protein n=1 Tax=Cladobotryum mycophilum TaxID=491253 RepID=A0ABR0SVC2_9HYPO
MVPTSVQSMREASANQSQQHATPEASTSTGDSSGQDNHDAPGRLLADGSHGRSIRERFNVNTQTGGISFTIPIQTSPGRSDFGPSLSLTYDSGSASGNGVFGRGWRLAGVDSITRKTSIMIPVYNDDEDTFVHSQVGDLVPVIQVNGKKPIEWDDKRGDAQYRVRLYRPRVESDPIRVQRWTCLDGSGDMHWKTISSGNVTTVLGRDSSSQIRSHRTHNDNGGALLIFSWLESETYDSRGNHMVLSYKGESQNILQASLADKVYEEHRNTTSQRYLESIKYGNKTPNRDLNNWDILRPAPQDDPWYWMFELIFDYGEYARDAPTTQEGPFEWNHRPDPFSVHSSGFEVRTYRRCERVLMFHHFEELKRLDCLVAATEFKYETDTKSRVSVLQSATQCGYQLDARKETYSCIRLPPTVFEYWAAPDLEQSRTESFDLNLAGLSSPAAQWVDLNGDGAPGVLAHAPGGGWYYHRNESSTKPAIGAPSLVSQVPGVIDSDGWSFEDLTGDGKLDLSFSTHDRGITGFYERMNNGQWANFVPFNSYPTAYSPMDPTIHKVDLNGNGSADLLQLANQQDNELSWYPSLGRQGYGAKKSTAGAPALPSGEVPFVLLSDMSGDGLADIVMICNSHICYWPNMGHGRFGSKVVMGNPPLLDDFTSFTPLRLRMVDITGSGTADLIYLPQEGGLHVYYNQSGNTWSEAHVLPTFPRLDHFCAVGVFDVGGRGTQCLVWTSDHYNSGGSAGSTTVRFLDLMGGNKPGLLTKCSNGIGGEVQITYRSSTQYHLDDERSGRAWPTRLPFPIECVERMVTKDLIAQTACTMRYAYHNGYYDPVERQFRGFQMVEEWDAEDFTTGSSLGQFHRPPVHTKIWFYIGLQRIDDATVLPDCYHTDKPQQSPLPASKISTKTLAGRLTADEVRDAYRALSGNQRRQEVFSDDDSPKSTIPYTVAQQTYEVVMHQGVGHDQRYGIFRVNSREELTSHYEREPNEAKIQHFFTLEIDDYGNIRKQAVVNYGKLKSQLEGEDQQRQKETFISYTTTDYTNAMDPLISSTSTGNNYFQAPLPSEVCQYRVLPRSEWVCRSVDRYTWETLAKSLPGTVDVPIHKSSAHSDIIFTEGSKILISKARTLYTATLNEPLPIHKQERFSIEYQSYQLSFTKDLLEATLKNGESPLLSPDQLDKELSIGGYVRLSDGNEEWWAPSARHLFTNGFNDRSSTSNLATARSHFYMPNAEVDQHGNVSRRQMDQYQLLLVKSMDAMKNETSFVNDYVYLQPSLVTDCNGNQTQTVFDPCGRSVGVAIMGKVVEDVGDSLAGFSVDLSPALLEEFIKDPSGPVAAQILQNAGSRTVYHDRYELNAGGVSGKMVPSFQAELVRHTHFRDAAIPSQISVHITYLDGNGGAIQEVTLSENTGNTKKWQFGGWVIRDNKNQPVRQFLPFTAVTHDFRPQEDSHSAPSTTLLRDPLSRVVAVLNGDHTWSKTRFTPWMQVDFDAGDTVRIDDPEADRDVGGYFSMLSRASYFPTWYQKETTAHQAISKSEVYHDTPKTAHVDSLGRGIVVEVSNRSQGSGDERSVTHQDYDVRGNVAQLRDAMDRVVTTTKYDLLGRPLFSINMDSGSHWELLDCSNLPLLSWSSRGIRQRVTYDQLRRIDNVKVLPSPDASSEMMIVKNIYGESLSNASKNNLRGQLHQCYDQSGLQTNLVFDFHGVCRESSVKFTLKYKQMLDWSERDGGNWKKPSQTVYTEDSSRNKVWRTYDVAGRLKTLRSISADEETTTSSVDNVEYSEDGKITLIRYGNESHTTHEYDTTTRRLVKTCTKLKDRTRVEEVSYMYDCLGRVIYKANQAHKTVFFDKSVVSPSQEFRYDALGQLIEATGREQVEISNGGQKRLRPFDAASGPRNQVLGDGSQLVEYVETYEYDVAGNIVKLHHTPRTAKDYTGWTRKYTYEEPSCIDKEATSNRLTRTAIRDTEEVYRYCGDGGQSGCITSVPGYSALTWDHNDKLRSFSTQKVRDGATPETTWYIYNAQGERVRKVTDRYASHTDSSPPTKSKETRYLPLQDVFIRYKGDGISISRSITTTSVGDSSISNKPMALLELDSSSEQLLVRYQASENLELSNSGQVISYEEYSPYGASTYQALVKGCLASTGSWATKGTVRVGSISAARDTTAHGSGADGLNLYRYVGNDPINFDDPQGMARGKERGPSTSAIPKDRTPKPKQENNSGNSSGQGASGPSSADPVAGSSGGKVDPKDVQEAIESIDLELVNGAMQSRSTYLDTKEIGLNDIWWTQDSIGRSMYDPQEGRGKDVYAAQGELRGRVKTLEKEGSIPRTANENAAEAFQQHFGRVIVGPDSNGGKNYHSWDNRRLWVMKNSLNKYTKATVYIGPDKATAKEYGAEGDIHQVTEFSRVWGIKEHLDKFSDSIKNSKGVKFLRAMKSRITMKLNEEFLKNKGASKDTTKDGRQAPLVRSKPPRNP